ncbi:MAG: biopolymer transporter ExbD [Acidobacteria bacterium]|jgi:biopolymer transport protein ExbD|nr:MAG: biopolymer transporter ExbD [Acidobacteriota bacterium]
MEDKEFSSINVIPLVDIMLVLLTIVLITATFVVQGSVPVNLPRAKSSQERAQTPLRLVLTKEGSVLYEGKPISNQELERLLSSLSKQTPISVLSDRDASVQSLVSLLDLLKKHKMERVHLWTELIR